MRFSEVVSGSQTWVEAFMAAVGNGCEFLSGDLPYVLSYYPNAEMNPFQRLLYSQASRHSFVVLPALKLQDLGSVGWNGRSVIHLHWLALILKDVSTIAAARIRIDAFIDTVAGWRASGHKVIWTMHNILPHDCALPEAETMLRQALIENLDAVHVLSRESVKEAAKYFSIPDELTFHVPHPTYEGWYPDVVSRSQARFDMEIEPGSFLYVFFGSIQPYKGVLELIAAFEAMRAQDRQTARLLIVGKPVDPEYLAMVREAVGCRQEITLMPNAMQDRDLQFIFNAADVVVAPYRKTLNSGVALLATTFGKPVIAPRLGGLMETFHEDSALLYDPDDPQGLQKALERARNHVPDRESIDRVRERHQPKVVSSEFFQAALRILGV
jgi:beta-1,4-mannosyltransferase